jgi:exodeoxyribonuclease-3
VKLASWNVNSIRARQEKVLGWVAANQPDVLCLQELKIANELFPVEEFRALGYEAAVLGQKTYNGVAILARAPLSDIALGLSDDVDDPQARLIAATVDGVRVLSAYVPNGQTVGSEKYAYKLAWLARLRSHLDARYRSDEALVLCGDFNAAPEARDVWEPERMAGEVLFHPDVRAALAHIQAFGLVDVIRQHHDEAGLYSWWDYRMLGFPKGHGARIDHIFASRTLAARCSSASIDRNARKGKLPSDHAPLLAEFAA